MQFNSQNKALLEDIYVHDSYFTACHFDYCKKQLHFSCRNSRENKVLCFTFFHVIYMNLQCCDFWHGGNRILWLNLVADQPKLHELRKHKKKEEKKQQKIDNSLFEQSQEILRKSPALQVIYDEMIKKRIGLIDDIDYLEIEFQLSSGDTLLIICESLSIETTKEEITS